MKNEEEEFSVVRFQSIDATFSLSISLCLFNRQSESDSLLDSNCSAATAEAVLAFVVLWL
ncbi:hypothetical protein MTR_7g033315 [Medicago truncatula]|uniref:Uncharacterized protein n=1 Tax=Medicago truncatula TaxID=3880 RepID=A0A072TXF0_MEDTR|nr:hypothetical protein MTR_7g033315 [Medicago truncatula]